MTALSFAEQDRREAERQAKRRDCVGRLAALLAEEFSLDELRLMWNDVGNAILIESFEIARTRTRR